jgi:mycothiol synthase
MQFSIDAFSHLTAEQTERVLKITRDASAVDEMAPLSEHVLIHLHHGGDSHDEHLVAQDEHGVIQGYLHLDATDAVEGPVVEIVVHPDARRNGIGYALVKAALDRTLDSRIRLWAHGELSSAYGLADVLGFEKSRELWQMRRSLYAPFAKTTTPDGVSIRTFQVGQDEAAWIELNSEVFEDHPEQGRMTREDLDVRMSESWFDAAGFLLATRVIDGAEKLVGYHWTKIHGGQGKHGHGEIGEIYVLGIAPSERGTGLGKSLSIRGLEYLRDKGLAAAMLYVDVENKAAIKLYESLGFAHWDTDVMFRKVQA